jgi:hypothetical protein
MGKLTDEKIDKMVQVGQKLDQVEKLRTSKLLLEAIRSNLNDAKTLDEAKGIVDGWLALFTAVEAAENGKLKELTAQIITVAKTDPETAKKLFIHGPS